jgi:hypothetical protein
LGRQWNAFKKWPTLYSAACSWLLPNNKVASCVLWSQRSQEANNAKPWMIGNVIECQINAQGEEINSLRINMNSYLEIRKYVLKWISMQIFCMSY